MLFANVGVTSCVRKLSNLLYQTLANLQAHGGCGMIHLKDRVDVTWVFFPGFYQTTCILKSDWYTIIDTNAHGKQKRIMQVKNLTSSEHTRVGKS